MTSNFVSKLNITFTVALLVFSTFSLANTEMQKEASTFKDKALEMKVASSESLPNSADALFGYMNKTNDKSKIIKAAEKFIRTLPNEPRRPDVMFLLGGFYLDAQLYAKARDLTKRFYAEYPNHKITPLINNLANAVAGK